MDNILEKLFSVDPIGTMLEDIDPESLYESSYSSLGMVMMEATTAAAIRGETSTSSGKQGTLLSKIWMVLKRAFEWIARRLKDLINFITSIFKKKSKSLDQIAEEVVGSEPQKKGKGTDRKVDKALKSFIVRFKEADSIEIEIVDLMDKFYNNRKPGFYLKDDNISRVIEAFPFIDNSAIIDVMTDFLSRVVKNNRIDVDELNSIINQFQDNEEKFWDKYKDNGMLTKYETKIRTLTEVQERVNRLNKVLTKIDARKLPEGIDSKGNKIDFDTLYNKLDKITAIAINIQMGLNNITNMFSMTYRLDERFFGSIKDVRDLASFTDKCIRASIPKKYFIRAIYDVAHSDLSGGSDKTDISHTLSGSSRLVIFPKKNTDVIKIALSELGRRSNKTELAVTTDVRGTPLAQHFALVTKDYEDSALVVAQRAGKITDSEALNFINSEVPGILREVKNFKIIDIHAANIGKINGKPVILDYGFAQRLT